MRFLLHIIFSRATPRELVRMLPLNSLPMLLMNFLTIVFGPFDEPVDYVSSEATLVTYCPWEIRYLNLQHHLQKTGRETEKTLEPCFFQEKSTNSHPPCVNTQLVIAKPFWYDVQPHQFYIYGQFDYE